MTDVLIQRAIKKSMKNIWVRYKITAICFDKNHNYLGMCCNNVRTIGGDGFRGLHAEQRAIKKYYPRLKYLILLRVNKNGKILPIECCDSCSRLCRKLNIKVLSIS